MNKLKFLILTIVLSLPYLQVEAQWVKKNNGLYGGNVTSFAFISNSIFVGTSSSGGVFRSNDSGANWTETGLMDKNILTTVADGTNIFAGTSIGLFLSTDNGVNWTELLSVANAYAIIVDGTNIFVGTYWDGVFMSTDYGVSWAAVNNGLTDLNVRTIAVNGTSIFAGTEGGGIFRTTDNGANWTAVNNGITSLNVKTIAVDGTNIYAGTDSGLFLSTDNGANWTAFGLASKSVATIVVDGTNIFATTWGYGIFRSTNNGATWIAVNNGLTDLNIQTIAVNGTNIYAGSVDEGIFVSTDNGTNWTSANNGLTSLNVTDIAVDGSNIFAGSGGSGIFRSTDYGANWAATNNGLTNLYVESIIVNGTEIFAGVHGSDGILRSTDNGVNWTPITSGGSIFNVITIVVDGTNIFVGTTGGIFLSTDNGVSWGAVNNGLTNLNIKSIIVKGTNIFAGTGAGVFRSTDNGANWTEVNNGLTNLNIGSMVVDGINIFAGTFYGGIFRSADNGANWTNVGLTNLNVTSMVVYGNNIFVSTWGGGIFLSTNNGANWAEIGLTGLFTHAIVVDGTNIFAGTLGGGSMWVRPLSDFIASTAEITSFSFTEQTGVATLGAGTIDIEVANDTDITTLVATFTLSSGATVEVGAAAQVSGTTANDFTSPVIYTVTAEDGVTTQDWTVTVTPAPSLLVVHYTFDGDALDQSGNGNNGTVTGATLTTDRHGNTNSAYSFNGVSDYIQTANVTTHPTGDIEITYMAWIKIATSHTGNIISFGELLDTKRSSFLYEGDAGGLGYAGQSNDFNSSIEPNQGEWVHVSVTKLGTSVIIYLDGAEVSQGTLPSSANITALDCVIGASPGVTNEFFNGDIDEVRVYNKALSATDISNIYNAEKFSADSEIINFSFTEQTGAATIGIGTIDIEVSNDTNLTTLVPTFTLSAGASAAVGGTAQVSDATANDFTNPVVYTITAEDGITTQNWTVTVTPAPSFLVAHYTFDGGITNDITNNGYNGTPISNPLFSVDRFGQYASALEPEGNGTYVSINHAGAWDMQGTVMINAWIRPNAMPLATEGTHIVFAENAFGDIAIDSDGFLLYIWSGGTVRSETGVIKVNQWSMITLVIDANDNLQLYVNGQIQHLKLDGTTTEGESIPITRNTGIGTNAYLGYNLPNQLYNGSIDDCRVYLNGLLTPTEINALYEAELSGGLDQKVASFSFTNGSLLDESGNLYEGQYRMYPIK